MIEQNNENSTKQNEEEKDQNYLQEQPTIGLPKSGKPWKKRSKQFKSNLPNIGLKLSWEEKQKLRKEKEELKQLLTKIKDEKMESIKKERQRLIQREKQKRLNDFKSGEFQLISNTKKIRKWNKKARHQLQKLPTELFEQIMEKKYAAN